MPAGIAVDFAEDTEQLHRLDSQVTAGRKKLWLTNQRGKMTRRERLIHNYEGLLKKGDDEKH